MQAKNKLWFSADPAMDETIQKRFGHLVGSKGQCGIDILYCFECVSSVKKNKIDYHLLLFSCSYEVMPYWFLGVGSPKLGGI